MKIHSFFNDVVSKNEAALPSYFMEDAVIRWHCTKEKFTVDEYVRVNCAYPGQWGGEIERIEDFGEKVILVARVFSPDGSSSFHLVSFISLKDGRISELDEYWADDEEAPDWRKQMLCKRSI